MSGADVWANEERPEAILIAAWEARGLPRTVAAEQVAWERSRAVERMLSVGLSKAEIARRIGGAGRVREAIIRAARGRMAPAEVYLSRPDIEFCEQFSQLSARSASRRVLEALSAWPHGTTSEGLNG